MFLILGKASIKVATKSTENNAVENNKGDIHPGEYFFIIPIHFHNHVLEVRSPLNPIQ